MMSSSLSSLRLPALFVAVLHLITLTAAAQEQQQEGQQKQEPPIPTPQLECRLFVAESTLPNAGVGIFTAVEKQKGDDIGVRDLCIPFVDLYWHNNDDFFPDPFRDYVWSGVSMGMYTESNTYEIDAYCPGLTSAVNCNPGILNLAPMTPEFDDGGLRRHEDPGVGAFTPYHNGTTSASRHIPAGGEVFKYYGAHWFDYRYEIFGEIPLKHHYKRASIILKAMDRVVHSSAVDHGTFEDLYKIILNLKNDDTMSSRIINAFPNSFLDALKVLKHHDGDIATGMVQPQSIRDVEWLQRNGRCIDHIRPGHSNIRQAGHGAFATRNLPKGTVITTSPLLHLPDRAFANMYNFTLSEDESAWVRVKDQIITKQLMLNYCYSHPQTSLLLCPYGPGINYINHDPDRRPNVKIRWAENFPIVHNFRVVESSTVDFLAMLQKPTLAFDYVATRDIAEGDELYLDYGDDWVTAWSDHVAQYEPYGDTDDAAHYEDSRFWNRIFNNSVLRTEDEQEFDPYPEHLEIRCHADLENNDGLVYFTWYEDDKGIPCRILFRHVVDEEDIAQFGAADRSGYRPKLRDYVYTVELEARDDSDSDQVTLFIKPNIPRQSIAFFDIPLTTDTRLPNSFRHWIGIPDDIMPEKWKNLQNGDPDPVTALLQERI